MTLDTTKLPTMEFIVSDKKAEELIMDKIDKAIKETFKTKIEQKSWMWHFQELLGSIEASKKHLEIDVERLEGFFDMIGLNKLSKQEWREKYLLTEKKEQ